MAPFIERVKNIRFFRKIIYAIVGVFSYPGLMIVNKLQIKGTENLEKLPKKL